MASRTQRLFTTALILAGLSVGTAFAQSGSGANGATGTADRSPIEATRHTERDDDGFNLGWLGLLGLAGLIPRKQKVVHHDRVATERPNTNRV
jgi:hypothetical protein